MCFFMNGCLPLIYEMSCELAYPIHEGIVGVSLTIAINVAAVVFLLLGLVPNIGVSKNIVCCLHLKIDVRLCARERQLCDIFHCYWWTASMKLMLLFSHAGYASGGIFPYLSWIYWQFCLALSEKEGFRRQLTILKLESVLLTKVLCYSYFVLQAYRG